MKKRLTLLMLAVAVLLPAVGQEVEVTSLKRLLEGVEGPAFYPVLNQTGDRLLFLTEKGGMKMYDIADDVTTTITTEFVAGNDACWGGDGKVYFVCCNKGEDNLIYRTGCSYDIGFSDMFDVFNFIQHILPGLAFRK